MPRNRVSTDADHVAPDPRPLNPTKTPPPKPWKKPAYTPLPIQKPYCIGAGQLPSHVNSSSPYDIFSLYFDDSSLQILADNTNKYAELNAPEQEQGPRCRPWFPTTLKELKA